VKRNFAAPLAVFFHFELGVLVFVFQGNIFRIFSAGVIAAFANRAFHLKKYAFGFCHGR